MNLNLEFGDRRAGVFELRFFLTLQAIGSIIFLYSSFALPSNIYLLAVLSIFLSVNTVGLSYYLVRGALNIVLRGKFTGWEKLLVTILTPLMVLLLIASMLAFLYLIWSRGASLESFQTFANTFAGVSTLLIASLGVSYLSLKRELEREVVKTKELETLRVKAEMRALRAHVDPHFIFNALGNAVSMLELGVASSRVVEYLNSLADLLRRTVELRDFCPLREEFEIAEKYLIIQKTRFNESLNFSLNLPKELEGRLVPTLLLQPLVENAVLHNLGKCGHPVEVRVSAAEQNSELVLTVSDNGCGGARIVEGHGLWLVRERLRLLSQGASLRIHSEPSGGTTVKVVIPNDANFKVPRG